VADSTASCDAHPWAEDPRRTGEGPGSDLVLGLRHGRDEAYEELIRRYQQPVYSLVYRLVEDPSDASDIVQEVFLKIFRSINRFRGESSLKTWIYRIAVNEAHNHRRWFCRHRRREIGMENEDSSGTHSIGNTLPDPGRSPFEIALEGETMALFETALAGIRPVFREAVVLRDVEDLSYEEIAEILQVSLGTVKSRILRGREALRQELTKRLDRGRLLGWTPSRVGQDWT
jgi:RNA polymerase sigma-70 factor (ECF subfamily)